MGYIYLIDDEIYVLATKDLVTFDESGNATCSINTPYTYSDGVVLTIELRLHRH
jgi:hypothetical protein